jgi:hypothetical protein
VRELVRRARRAGYVAKPGDREKRIAAIAVPILHGERVFACLNTVMLRKAMSIPEAVRRYLGPLRETAASIAQQLESGSLWPAQQGAVRTDSAGTPPSEDRRPRSRIPAYVER